MLAAVDFSFSSLSPLLHHTLLTSHIARAELGTLYPPRSIYCAPSSISTRPYAPVTRPSFPLASTFSRVVSTCAMASASPPPPPDPNRLRTSPCCGSSSSSPPRNALRRSKTVANPESPLRWRREPLVDVTNLVLGRAGRELTGRLQVSSPPPLCTSRITTPQLASPLRRVAFFRMRARPDAPVHQRRRSCLDECILRECRCTEGCTVKLHGL